MVDPKGNSLHKKGRCAEPQYEMHMFGISIYEAHILILNIKAHLQCGPFNLKAFLCTLNVKNTCAEPTKLKAY